MRRFEPSWYESKAKFKSAMKQQPSSDKQNIPLNMLKSESEPTQMHKVLFNVEKEAKAVA